ncbi:MAG: PadR family transcriptional regulator [Planctomycetaceae bacterium]|nr:PadR family transcriptional regulator [Planctomycetaceae bacterium]
MSGSQSNVPPRILQGTLNMMVLRILSDGAEHGYGIARKISERSKDGLLIKEGSLYPALHRLEKNGLVSSEWRASESNRRAKYYRLTAKGKQELASEAASWQQASQAINNVMTGLT